MTHGDLLSKGAPIDLNSGVVSVAIARHVLKHLPLSKHSDVRNARHMDVAKVTP